MNYFTALILPHRFQSKWRKILLALGILCLASFKGLSSFAAETPASANVQSPSTQFATTERNFPVNAKNEITEKPQSAGETQAVQNPYGLGALWAQGDLIAKSTLILLLLMSLGSWYVIVIKLLEQWRIRSQASSIQPHFWQKPLPDFSTQVLNNSPVYHQVTQQGVQSAQDYHGVVTTRVDFNTWLNQSIQSAVDDIRSQLGGGLAFLATVGSTAPFIGLFGTVWGIYHALTAIGISGQASIDKVAGPVGESLIMTAIGLAVAVPAVLGYNALTRKNKTEIESLNRFGEKLHAKLLKESQLSHADVLNQ